MSEPSFAVGDPVRWTSQSSGYRSDKQGKVVALVPAGTRPTIYGDPAAENRARIDRLFEIDADAYALSKLGGGSARERVSYLVAVPGPSERARPRLYWPLVEKLEAAEGAG